MVRRYALSRLRVAVAPEWREEHAGRVKRMMAEAEKAGVSLSDEVVKELVRSSEVGITTKITFHQGGRVKMQVVPRATVVKPAPPQDALKGRRDVQPWGASILGPVGAHPFRDTPSTRKMTAELQRQWDARSGCILKALQRALQD